MRSTAPSKGCASPPRTRRTAVALLPPRTCRPRTACMRSHSRRCTRRHCSRHTQSCPPSAGAGLRRTRRSTSALRPAASCRWHTARTTFGRWPAGMPPPRTARMRCCRLGLGTPRWRRPRTMQRRSRSTDPPCSSCTAQSQTPARCAVLQRRRRTATAPPRPRTCRPRTACMRPHWHRCSCRRGSPGIPTHPPRLGTCRHHKPRRTASRAPSGTGLLGTPYNRRRSCRWRTCLQGTLHNAPAPRR